MLLLGQFEILRPVDQQTKLEVITLMGINYPVYRQTLGLVLHNDGEEEYVWYLLRVPLALGKLFFKIFPKKPNNNRQLRAQNYGVGLASNLEQLKSWPRVRKLWQERKIMDIHFVTGTICSDSEKYNLFFS